MKLNSFPASLLGMNTLLVGSYTLIALSETYHNDSELPAYLLTRNFKEKRDLSTNFRHFSLVASTTRISTRRVLFANFHFNERQPGNKISDKQGGISVFEKYSKWLFSESSYTLLKWIYNSANFLQAIILRLLQL